MKPTIYCRISNVTFLIKCAPTNAPTNAVKVAAKTICQLFNNPALVMCPAYTGIRVKSTNMATATPVAIKASLSCIALLRNAERSAP